MLRITQSIHTLFFGADIGHLLPAYPLRTHHLPSHMLQHQHSHQHKPLAHTYPLFLAYTAALQQRQHQQWGAGCTPLSTKPPTAGLAQQTVDWHTAASRFISDGGLQVSRRCMRLIQRSPLLWNIYVWRRVTGVKCFHSCLRTKDISKCNTVIVPCPQTVYGSRRAGIQQAPQVMFLSARLKSLGKPLGLFAKLAFAHCVMFCFWKPWQNWKFLELWLKLTTWNTFSKMIMLTSMGHV